MALRHYLLRYFLKNMYSGALHSPRIYPLFQCILRHMPPRLYARWHYISRNTYLQPLILRLAHMLYGGKKPYFMILSAYGAYDITAHFTTSFARQKNSEEHEFLLQIFSLIFLCILILLFYFVGFWLGGSYFYLYSRKSNLLWLTTAAINRHIF